MDRGVRQQGFDLSGPFSVFSVSGLVPGARGGDEAGGRHVYYKSGVSTLSISNVSQPEVVLWNAGDGGWKCGFRIFWPRKKQTSPTFKMLTINRHVLAFLYSVRGQQRSRPLYMGYLAHKKRTPLGPYSRTMPRALRWP